MHSKKVLTCLCPLLCCVRLWRTLVLAWVGRSQRKKRDGQTIVRKKDKKKEKFWVGGAKVSCEIGKEKKRRLNNCSQEKLWVGDNNGYKDYKDDNNNNSNGNNDGWTHSSGDPELMRRWKSLVHLRRNLYIQIHHQHLHHLHRHRHRQHQCHHHHLRPGQRWPISPLPHVWNSQLFQPSKLQQRRVSNKLSRVTWYWYFNHCWTFSYSWMQWRPHEGHSWGWDMLDNRHVRDRCETNICVMFTPIAFIHCVIL